MRIEVSYCVDYAGAPETELRSETEDMEAESSQQAIDFIIDYLAEQVAQNSNFSPIKDGEKIDVMNGDEVVERYYNFSAKSPVKELRKKLGMSQAETARLLEMPVWTLQDWEAGKRTPAHWAEKLVLEKLESLRK